MAYIRALKRILEWFFKPRQIKIPRVVWIILLVGVLVLLTRPTPSPIEREVERTVIVTATPPASTWYIPTPVPGSPPITPTPVGSGGTLAFSMRHNGNSDIYLLSQNTGNLLRLTFDPGEDRHPVWAPDGQHLAFASQRNDGWDLYLIEMSAGTVIRLTRTPDYQAAPSWSPDGKWLAYEAYVDGNLDIYILNVERGDSQRLTSDPEPEYSPAWSPDGRHIAFTAYRDDNKDLYVISLDDGITVNVSNTPDQNEDYAAWSPDGRYLVYSAGVPGNETIWKIPFDKEALVTGMLRPSLFGVGGQPTWSPDGRALAFIFRQQATSYLIAADTTGWGLAQEGYSTVDWMDTPSWTLTPLNPELEARLVQRMGEEESPLYTELLLSENPDKYQLVNLPNVNHSDSAEKLSDKVNDSYNALRKAVEEQTGLDYLSILGDSWRTMNYTPRPGQGRISWHVCGRAVDINQGFLSSGQIELVREDIGGVTYWRVYIKAKEQDGSQGEPLRVAPWDLSSRSKGGLATAQGGELKEKIPEGYYVDFTTIAADYGWERRNALSNWRSSYYDVEWWHFQKTEGMSWYECMEELYTTDTISESYGILPWWTKRPEWEVQSMP
ncbi:MAG: DPP IV N-terminal domain-containing protein [Anaerolineae bacterium]